MMMVGVLLNVQCIEYHEVKRLTSDPIGCKYSRPQRFKTTKVGKGQKEMDQDRHLDSVSVPQCLRPAVVEGVMVHCACA